LDEAEQDIQNYLDLGQCYLPQPLADNIDLGLNNSGYPAQPHPIIVNTLFAFCILRNTRTNSRSRLPVISNRLKTRSRHDGLNTKQKSLCYVFVRVYVNLCTVIELTVFSYNEVTVH
jgi:hypothetical protein